MRTADQESRWLAVRVGQVLKAPSGRLRVVRAVSPWRPGTRLSKLRGTHIFLTIGHPSWTGRCYTCYNLGELIGIGYELLHEVYRVEDDFQRLFLEDAAGVPRPWNFGARDVAGIP
jgi:hypothetical protein